MIVLRCSNGSRTSLYFNKLLRVTTTEPSIPIPLRAITSITSVATTVTPLLTPTVTCAKTNIAIKLTTSHGPATTASTSTCSLFLKMFWYSRSDTHFAVVVYNGFLFDSSTSTVLGFVHYEPKTP